MSSEPINQYKRSAALRKVKPLLRSSESRFQYYVQHDDSDGVPMVWLYRYKLVSGQRIEGSDEVVMGVPSCDFDAVCGAFAEFIKQAERAAE